MKTKPGEIWLVVNVQGLSSIIDPRLERKLGQIPVDLMAEVKDALRFTLDL